MLKKDEGIILKCSKSGGSTRIITFLGEESGKIRLVAKGALKKNSPFSGSLEAGSAVEVVYYYKGDRHYYYLKEITVKSSCRAEEKSLETMATVLAVLELLDQVCHEGCPAAEQARLAEDFIASNFGGDSLLKFLVFELKLLDTLGFLPEFDICCFCGERISQGFFDPGSGSSCCAKDRSAGGDNLLELNETVLGVISGSLSRSFYDLEPARADAGTRKNFGLILHWTYTYHIHGYKLPNALKLIKKESS